MIKDQAGNNVYVITSEKYAWWKNLRGNSVANLIIRGKHYTGKADIANDRQTVLNTFAKIYPTRSGYESLASGCVAIHISV